jgi:hypothetical protein
MAAAIKIYSDSACAIELTGTPYTLDLGEFDGTNGETKTTSILVKNTGADTAGVVTLTETADTDTRGSYSIDDITYSASSLSLGTIVAGASVRVYIKVIVAALTTTKLTETLNFTVAGTGTSKSVAATYSISTILDSIKTALRISGTDLDGEIEDLLLAVKADLQLSGLLGEKILVTDALIKRAIIVYCKANFGWDNPEAERFQKSYDMLKNHMSLSRDYAYYAITFVVVNSIAAAIDEVKIIFDGVEKLTNASGIAIFYVREGSNYEYQITHNDYADYVDSDGEWYNVDVSASVTINITITAV